jgi:hypothetical protein
MVFDKVHESEWFEVPPAVGGPKLYEARDELRKKNLHDTEEPPLAKATTSAPAEAVTGRTVDGSYNDLSCPFMGRTGARFGRNTPLQDTFPDTDNLMNPSPRTVSVELFTRTTFQPVPFLNVLAAAWIQFEVHDWFVHQKGSWDKTHEVPLAAGDNWHESPMRIPITPADSHRLAGSKRPPAYINDNSHWWDGSQVYGSDAAAQKNIRTGQDGKIRVGCRWAIVDRSHHWPRDNGHDGQRLGRAQPAAWPLRPRAQRGMRSAQAAQSELGRRKTVQQARLVVSALIAKIHTVEWSTSILPRPLVSTGLRANWYGLLRDAQNVLTGLQDNDLLAGIPGSATEHHTAPYSLTEEFVSVYRMHPLLPDDFVLHSASTGAELGRYELPQMSGQRGRQIVRRFELPDLFYSLGIAHPGAIRLHNYPRHLQNLVKDSGERFDMATVDIMRDRERGVPRYNAFRRMVHKQPYDTIEEMTDNPQWAQEIKHVYNNDIEKVDLMVGLMAETLPEGMGFSDTAFRIFLLMASRRLKSDRFLSKDYRPEVYTKEGIDWVEENSMIDVLKRHFPQLGPALKDKESAFHPWNAVKA